MDKNVIEYFGDDGSKIIFDSKTYYEIALSCLEKYANKTKKESTEILNNSSFFNKCNFPPKTYNAVALLDNELIYDMAMMALYRDEYWNHPNYIKLEFDKYYEWENKIIVEKKLNSDYIDYL